MGNSVAGIHNYRKRETLVSRGSYFQHYDCQATEKTALVRDVATAGSCSSLHCLAYGLIYVFSSVKKDTLNAAKRPEIFLLSYHTVDFFRSDCLQ